MVRVALAKRQLSAEQLDDKAVLIRRSIFRMLEKAGSGHSAGPLGMADILAALYFRILKHDPAHPGWEDRDIFLLSNGHTAPVLYAAMAHSGYFPVEELDTLRKYGSRLQGHPERVLLTGLENTSGPLGSGLSQACEFVEYPTLRFWGVWRVAPQSFSGTPSTSTAPSPPSIATKAPSARICCGSSHPWDGNTSTSPATTPDTAPANPKLENSDPCAGPGSLSVLFIPFRELAPRGKRPTLFPPRVSCNHIASSATANG